MASGKSLNVGSPLGSLDAAEGICQGVLDRSYQAALRYWSAWHDVRYGKRLRWPVSVEVVVQFVRDHTGRYENGRVITELPPDACAFLTERGFRCSRTSPALSTLEHRISALSHVHAARQLSNPCHAPSVRALLKEARRRCAQQGLSPMTRPPLTREALDRILDTCDESLRGKRDRALLLFTWSSGGRRPSEVANAVRENLFASLDGYRYALGGGRMGSDSTTKPVQGRAAAALSDWLSASGIIAGPLFRRIGKGGRLGDRLSEGAIRAIVKSRCTLAGIKGNFSAHSLRSGFVADAASQGASLAEIMGLTGHTSVSAVARHQRRALILNRRPEPMDTRTPIPNSSDK